MSIQSKLISDTLRLFTSNTWSRTTIEISFLASLTLFLFPSAQPLESDLIQHGGLIPEVYCNATSIAPNL